MSDLIDLPPAPEAIRTFTQAIVTPRLELRLVEAADVEALYRHFADWEVVRWLARPSWPMEPAMMADFLDGCSGRQAAGEAAYRAIARDGEAVGAIDWSYGGGASYLGYWLGRAHWGQGLMSEAAAAFVDAIFAVSNERAILSGVFEGNVASHAIQMKLGFVETGLSVHYSVPRGVDLRHIDTKLTRTARRVAALKATT
ncbi:MAG: GNAT family N-acetyltransferase [Ancalomicrobiaceae bacterium]|nr:GNAT family N-acetyltransferase [Ancalomicrobiaceae bacterium]